MPRLIPALLVASLLLALGMVVGHGMGASISALLAVALAGLGGVIATAAMMAMAPAKIITHHLPPEPRQLWQDEEFQQLIDRLDFPLLLTTGESVSTANRAARDLLGGFIIGADVRAAIRHPAAADHFAEADADPAAEPHPVGLIGVGRPGERWEMRSWLLSANQRVIQLTDLTGRDAIERMRVDFVANASHELRTPLAAIIGFIETLADPDAGGDDAVRARFLGIMEREARRLQSLVDDLLSISRIEASKAEPPSASIDLSSLIRSVVADVSATDAERGRDIRLELGEAGPVIGDAGQLSQLLHNIIVNAMKYGTRGAPITIRTATAGGQMLALSVADQGEGISPEQLPRITERFYRVDSARSRALGGTGLGLAIVKHIVERHRGRLDIESRPGAGTTVHIRLPRAGVSTG